MQSRCWVTPNRYYHISLQSDLFGQISVVKSWGGRHNKLGGCESIPIEHTQEAENIFSQVAKQRSLRGYTEII